MHVVIPLLVIPDGRIWIVNYSEDGSLLGSPSLCPRLSLFVGKTWKVGHVDPAARPGYSDCIEYRMSHLEIVTLSFLEEFCNQYLGGKTNYSKLFSEKSGCQVLHDLFARP